MEVEGYPNYLVYEDGRVFGKKRRKMLKPCQDGHGYHLVRLYNDSKKKMFRVHRLVAMVYIPNPENKAEVDHIDRDKSNNHVSNLRWATRSENNQNTIFRKDNKLGIKNICWDEYCKRYKYQKKIMENRHSKCFRTLEEAIAYKTEYERNLCIEDAEATV
jgi:hypothetical protein